MYYHDIKLLTRVFYSRLGISCLRSGNGFWKMYEIIFRLENGLTSATGQT